MKLSKLKKRSEKYDLKSVAYHRSNDYYAFQKTLIDIVENVYTLRRSKMKKPRSFQANPTEVFAWNWLFNQKQYILNQSFVKKLTDFKLISNDKSAKTHLPADVMKRLDHNEQLANKNKKFLLAPLRTTMFEEPHDQKVNTISTDRLEFSQYVNEAVHLMGKIKRVSKDNDTHGNTYLKLLLVNCQFYPASPSYMLKKAMILPDHIWIDINSPELQNRTYVIDEYIVFSGIVGEYRSKVNKYQSQLKHHTLDYWRTKYNILNPTYLTSGEPIINDQHRIKAFVSTNNDPSKEIHPSKL